jgi:hypothetical protein
MGREGFFLEVSLTLSYTVQLLMFLPKSSQLTAMGREGFFLEVSSTLSYTVQFFMILSKSSQLTAMGREGFFLEARFNSLRRGPTPDISAQSPAS